MIFTTRKRKKIYLHIGMEKTGSTALQYFLLLNEKQLNEDGFSYFCNEGRPYFSRFAHSPIAASFLSEYPIFVEEKKYAPASQVLAALQQDLASSEKDAIISCEHFSSRLHEKEPLTALKTAFKDHDLYVVCYLRAPLNMALSAYSTQVLSGRTAPLRQEEVHPDNPYFNFQRTLLLWESVFGKDALIVHHYHPDVLSQGDICHDFLKLLGIPNPDKYAYEDKKRNRSLDMRQTELLRIINAQLPAFDDKNRRPFYDAQSIRGTLANYVPAGIPLTRLLSQQDQAAIRARFKEMTQWLEMRYFSPGALSSWLEEPSEGIEKISEINTMNDLQDTAIAMARFISEHNRAFFLVRDALEKDTHGTANK